MAPFLLRGEGTQTSVDDNEIDDQMVLPSTLEKDMAAPQSLIEHFAKLEDPRVDRNKKHELIDVIVLCVCAVVSGANGWSDIEEFGRAKLEWLRRYVPLANGVPVDDTIARIVSALSVSGFQECFRSWVEDVVTLGEGEIVAVDGKTHRRSHDRKNGVKALHMVSAWASRNGVVLGQVKTQEKSNEITAVPELLKKLELKGCIVTVDAMGCQREVAQKVHEGGGDYVLAVKDNQEQLARELRGYFEAAQGEDFEWPEIENEETADEGHGRVEYRSCFLSTDLSHLSVGGRWTGLKAIGMAESERHVDPNVANNLYPIVGKSPISQDLVSIFDCRSDSPQVRLNSTAIPTIRSLK